MGNRFVGMACEVGDRIWWWKLGVGVRSVGRGVGISRREICS